MHTKRSWGGLALTTLMAALSNGDPAFGQATVARPPAQARPMHDRGMMPMGEGPPRPGTSAAGDRPMPMPGAPGPGEALAPAGDPPMAMPMPAGPRPAAAPAGRPPTPDAGVPGT